MWKLWISFPHATLWITLSCPFIVDNPSFFVEKEREMEKNVVNERLLFHFSTEKMWISDFHKRISFAYCVNTVDNLIFLIAVFDFSGEK